jgi:hypothetical protein
MDFLLKRLKSEEKKFNAECKKEENNINLQEKEIDNILRLQRMEEDIKEQKKSEEEMRIEEEERMRGDDVCRKELIKVKANILKEHKQRRFILSKRYVCDGCYCPIFYDEVRCEIKK